MTKLRIGLLIAAGVLLLAVGAAGTVFYVKIYRPIQAPLTALFGAKTLEDRRLQNHAEFQPPDSAELTPEQAANFAAVEEAVQQQLAAGAALLAQKQADVERARAADALSVRSTLLVFGDIKAVYLNAKMAQIDAMNRVRFSKKEFEWVRRQLYAAAGLPLSQLDVSEILGGVRDAIVEVRQITPGVAVPESNARLARPLAAKLQIWLALGFFGL